MGCCTVVAQYLKNMKKLVNGRKHELRTPLPHELAIQATVYYALISTDS